MQTLGHIIVKGEKIKVLIRPSYYGVNLKIRKSGKDGTCFFDESEFLRENPLLVERLKKGFVICI